MFSGFSNVWTAALTSGALGATKPASVMLAGERIAFFRDADGRARALVDRCPHRGVRLSLGTVKDGCLACPFHGWQFDGTGKACVVPFNPDAKTGPLAATALPVEERAGIIWLYTAPLSEGVVPPLVLPETLERPTLARAVLEVEWKTHWTRAMENMLDWPHLPFVHTQTIGRDMVPAIAKNARLDVEIDELPHGLTSSIAIDGAPKEGRLDFFKPNMMVLHIIETPARTFCMHVAVIPVDETTTRMLVVNTRSFLRWRGLNPLFALSNRKIVSEDRDVVESSFPLEVPPAGHEVSVRTDKLPLQFRKYYFETLRPQSASVRALPVLQSAG